MLEIDGLLICETVNFWIRIHWIESLKKQHLF